MTNNLYITAAFIALPTISMAWSFATTKRDERRDGFWWSRIPSTVVRMTGSGRLDGIIWTFVDSSTDRSTGSCSSRKTSGETPNAGNFRLDYVAAAHGVRNSTTKRLTL